MIYLRCHGSDELEQVLVGYAVEASERRTQLGQAAPNARRVHRASS